MATTLNIPARDWETASLGELVDHIINTHHMFLRRELPRVSHLVNQVVAVHPEQAEIRQVFEELRTELESHMMKEEIILFPHIKRLAAGGTSPHACFGSVAGPIRVMEAEHASANRALDRLRELTGNYQPPDDACSTFRSMVGGLANIDDDLQIHIHLENDVLFPGVAQMEKN